MEGLLSTGPSYPVLFLYIEGCFAKYIIFIYIEYIKVMCKGYKLDIIARYCYLTSNE